MKSLWIVALSFTTGCIGTVMSGSGGGDAADESPWGDGEGTGDADGGGSGAGDSVADADPGIDGDDPNDPGDAVTDSDPSVSLWSVAGRVSGARVEGVAVGLSGARTAATTTDASGVYRFETLPDGDYVLTPHAPGYSFTPPSLAVTVAGAAVTGRDFVATAAPTEILVDYGATAGGNVYGVPGWTTVIASPTMDYTSAGPGGLSATQSFDGAQRFYPFAGISGPAREFVYGDRIVVTWYNNSGSALTIIPLISFSDTDEPSATVGQPQWHTMYPLTYTLHSGTYNTEQYAQRIPAGQSLAVNFKIHDGTIEAPTAMSSGLHTVVNLSLRRADNSAPVIPAGALVLDKIELRHDVDTQPPAAATDVSVHAEAWNRVHLTWTQAIDDVAVTGYRIYRDGKRHYRLDYDASEYLDAYVTPGRTYTYEVVPFDAEMNEGLHQEYPVTLPAFAGTSTQIDPTTFAYLGAFRMPTNGSDYAYSLRGLAYYPLRNDSADPGDPQNLFPGSLFVTGNANHMYVSELSIPVPVISATKSVDGLPSTRALQPLSPIRTPPTAVWPMMNIGYLPAQGAQTSGKLYTAYYDQYRFTKGTVFGWAELDLANPSFRGDWSAGPLDGPPAYYAACRFLAEIPQTWADANAPGYRLLTGYYRPGALNGYGVSLYALAPWLDGNPPADGAALTTVQLLQYGPFSTDLRRPHKMHGFDMSDRFWDAEWLTADGRSAVAVAADKVFGESWYGNPDGTLWTRILFNVPSCDASHGWYPSEYRPIIMLFDPNELADVAQGRKQSWEPQPYAYIDLTPYMFDSSSSIEQKIGGIAYDAANRVLYVEEVDGDPQRSLLIHAFRVN